MRKAAFWLLVLAAWFVIIVITRPDPGDYIQFRKMAYGEHQRQ